MSPLSRRTKARVASKLPTTPPAVTPKSARGSLVKVSIAPPRLLVEAVPRSPAPDASTTRPTSSEITARCGDSPL